MDMRLFHTNCVLYGYVFMPYRVLFCNKSVRSAGATFFSNAALRTKSLPTPDLSYYEAKQFSPYQSLFISFHTLFVFFQPGDYVITSVLKDIAEYLLSNKLTSGSSVFPRKSFYRKKRKKKQIYTIALVLKIRCNCKYDNYFFPISWYFKAKLSKK